MLFPSAIYRTHRGDPRASNRRPKTCNYQLFPPVSTTPTVSSTRLKISRWDAYVRQIYNMALNKNSGAAPISLPES
jgi:hypothetical protein